MMLDWSSIHLPIHEFSISLDGFHHQTQETTSAYGWDWKLMIGEWGNGQKFTH